MCVCVCAHLDPFPVKPDIPVCQLVYESHQTRYHSVQSIHCREKLYLIIPTYPSLSLYTIYFPSHLPLPPSLSFSFSLLTGHFLFDKGKQRLCEAEDPLIHHVGW